MGMSTGLGSQQWEVLWFIKMGCFSKGGCRGGDWNPCEARLVFALLTTPIQRGRCLPTSCTVRDPPKSERIPATRADQFDWNHPA